MRNSKGFTMIEVLVCIMIISCLSLIYLSFKPFVFKDHHMFMYDYWYAQIQSMLQSKETALAEDGCYFAYPLYFNEKGNVNRAQTITCFDSQLVVELGLGRLVEK